MRIKDGMVLTKLDDDFVAVSVGDIKGFRGIVKMNKTGAAIWNLLSEGLEKDEIARKLLEKYDGVDYETALKEVESVIRTLKEKELLTD